MNCQTESGSPLLLAIQRIDRIYIGEASGGSIRENIELAGQNLSKSFENGINVALGCSFRNIAHVYIGVRATQFLLVLLETKDNFSTTLQWSILHLQKTFVSFFLFVESNVAVAKTFSVLWITCDGGGPNFVSLRFEKLLQVEIIEARGRQITYVETGPCASVSLLVNLLSRRKLGGRINRVG